MKTAQSYAVELLKFKNIVRQTIRIYRKAVAFLIEVIEKEWDDVSAVETSLGKVNLVERLVHSTSKRVVKYDFDTAFHKFPSYLLRGAISVAIGSVSSYKSNYKNWEAGGRAGNPPKLTYERFLMPCFYNGNMYLSDMNNGYVYLKLYIDKDWKFVPVKVKKTDVKYIRKYWTGVKESAPTLEYKHGKYFLRFLFKTNVELSDTPILNKRILSVDLGINTDAVCTVMESDGTILLREFINFGSDKDYLNHQLNKLKKFQRLHGSHNVKSRWENIKRHNIEHGRKVGNAIAELATSYNCDVIVFEYLDIRGKKVTGSKRQKLALWRKNSIQKVCEGKAHFYGIRISRICAWGTSKYAFDGSGKVERDKTNHRNATFLSGKKYNADLSASYNIGARYFLRELQKSLPEKVRSRLLAKVPEAGHRTSCTYHTLRTFYPLLEDVMRTNPDICLKLAG